MDITELEENLFAISDAKVWLLYLFEAEPCGFENEIFKFLFLSQRLGFLCSNESFIWETNLMITNTGIC